MELKPLPSFYSVYLLRSSIKPSVTYIGSTPDPRRRLRQHNGLIPGGARRTHKENLRPWIMQLVVHGFPSRISALQFEWAWQNPHVTRRIEREERVELTGVGKRGGGRRRRPVLGLKGVLEVLRGLVECRAHRRWGLTVRVFEEGCWEVWRGVREGREGVETLLDARREVEVGDEDEDAEVEGSQKKVKRVGPKGDGMGGVLGLDITNDHILPTVLKARAHLSKPRTCILCKESLSAPFTDTLICTHSSCTATSHIKCLASKFLSEDPEPDLHVLPVSGKCPKCKKTNVWKVMIQELSVRTRVPVKEPKVPKKPGKAKIIAVDSEAEDSELEEDDDEEDEAEAETVETSTLPELDDYRAWIYQPPDDDFDQLEDNWEDDIASERAESMEPEFPPSSSMTGSRMLVLIEE